MAFSLPTLDEMAASRRGQPIPKGPSRLDVKAAKGKATNQAWEACKRTVDARDGMRCRACRRKVEKVIDLQANRAEHHHIVRRRKVPALLTDARNVVLLCYTCHDQVTTHVLAIIGKAKDRFALEEQRYLNADKPLSFPKAKAS